MARKATGKGKGGDKPRARKKSARKAKSSSGSQKRASRTIDPGEAFVKLLQSPLAAELVAVAATAALASLAEQGFTSRDGASAGTRAGRAVKAAGKAAAGAVARRLGTEIEEIRKAAKGSKAGAKA